MSYRVSGYLLGKDLGVRTEFIYNILILNADS